MKITNIKGKKIQFYCEWHLSVVACVMVTRLHQQSKYEWPVALDSSVTTNNLILRKRHFECWLHKKNPQNLCEQTVQHEGA